jgi:hypothetical protein
MIASRTTVPRDGRGVEHGLPTAADVRSSQATPARRRGQACQETTASDDRLRRRVAHPGDGIAGVDNTGRFKRS